MKSIINLAIVLFFCTQTLCAQSLSHAEEFLNLQNKAVAAAKENSFEVIDLQVRSDNSSAIHLYEKFGFKKIGTHPVFFKIGSEEVAFDYMCLKIQ